jgi:predicted PurR-regulated permease PerM
MGTTTEPNRPGDGADGSGAPVAEPASGRRPESGGVPKEDRRPRRLGIDLYRIRAGITVIAALGILALLRFAASVFITLFSSLLLAFALEPLVHFFCVRTRLRRQFASGVVVFLFIALLYGIFYLAYLRVDSFLADIPEIAEKVRSAPLLESMSQKAGAVNDLLAEAGRRIAPVAPPAHGRSAPPILVRDAGSLTGALVESLGSLTSVVFSLSFIPFLVYFMLADREPLTRRTRELFPREHRDTVGGALVDIERMLRKFLIGNAMIAAILSAATVVIFILVKLPYPVVLGVLSGMLSIVPYLGLLLALLPGVVVGAVTFGSPVPFLVMVAAVTGLHLAAVNYLTPRFVGSEVHLNATASTAALLFFGWLWGGMGLLLGIPVVAILKCILDNVASTRRIGMWLGD